MKGRRKGAEMGEKSCIGTGSRNPATTGQVPTLPPGHLTGCAEKTCLRTVPQREEERSFSGSFLPVSVDQNVSGDIWFQVNDDCERHYSKF